MFNIKQFREDIVAPTLGALQIRNPNMSELLVFTCAVESAGGTYVRQIKGPALGIYQIEPTTFSDLFANYILRKPDILNLFTLNLGLHRMPSPEQVITDLRLATALAACLYMYRKANLPQNKILDADELWNIYKPLYNTVKGKSEKEASIKAYQRFIKS